MSPVGRALADLRQRFPDAHSVVVAYSGGRDSHVLLHAAQRFAGLSVRAVHVSHGLQSAAERWPAHCHAVCVALEVPLTIAEVEVHSAGQGVEAAAREARYQVFEQQTRPGELLLQAHHADDQAETLMLRLLRGTGLRGMGAMPEQRKMGSSVLWRPLLALDGAALGDYAETHQLSWIEDPSNQDTHFDRNYLRQQVMPLLSARWPQMAKQLGAAARRAQSAELLLNSLLAPVLEKLGDHDGSFCCDGLMARPNAEQPHLLRAWLATHSQLPPTENQLQVLLQEVVCARRDADPCLQILGAEVRRHRERLYWVQITPIDLPAEQVWSDLSQPIAFASETLSFDSAFGRQLLIPAGARVRLCVRQGGERIRLRGGERPLKKVMQDLSLPSWLRDRTPLLYVDDELAAIWNYSIAVKFQKNQ